MKKMYVILLFLSLCLLGSCDKSPVCNDDEMLIDGTCVPLDEEIIALKEAIGTMQNSDNYLLTIGLSRGEEQDTIELAFDGERSSFAIDDSKEYYEKTPQGCFRYVETTDGYVKESYGCSNEPSLFYLDFSYDWFTWIDQAYYLEYQHLDHVSQFFQSEMEGSHASNFTLTLNGSRFDRFNLDVNHGGAIWNITMTFSDFDSVEIDLEEVES